MKRFWGYVPAAAFLLTLAMGLALSVTAQRALQPDADLAFDRETGAVVARVEAQLKQYIALLRATRAAIVVANGTYSAAAFGEFTEGLDLKGTYQGIQGIGICLATEPGSEATVEAQYRLPRRIWPSTDQALRTPIVMLEPHDERNLAALGYDMYADATRRQAMDAAVAANAPVMSPPVHLVQEINERKQAGFLIYLPLWTTEHRLAGFVYAPFRAEDFVEGALGSKAASTLAFAISDADSSGLSTLYQSAAFSGSPADALQRQTVRLAGRNWQFAFARPDQRASLWRAGIPVLLVSASVLLGALLWVILRSQQRFAAAAEQLAATQSRAVEERELLLQEMQHRLKNSISRILAIARNTGSSAADIGAFNASFTARLQAMAAAQDLLTRSNGTPASLRALVRNELGQVFGDDDTRVSISGDNLLLPDRQVHALGLLIHELATNALKYGAGAAEHGSLAVSWTLLGDGNLALTWTEVFPVSNTDENSPGFGSRLVRILIETELRGSMDRRFTADGLSISLRFPVGQAPQGRAPSAPTSA